MSSSRHLVDGKYSIRDLVDLKELRRIFQNFTDSIGFTIGFLSVPDLQPLIKTGWRDICTRYHRMCPLAIERCRKSNIRLARHLTRPGQVVIEKCENGLVDCATPIIIKGKYIAILATGQVLLEAPDLNQFRRQARAFGCNEKKYMAALAEIPVISSKRLKQVTGFLKELALLVAELGYAGLKEKEKAQELELDIQRRIKAEKALTETTDQLQVLFGAVTDGLLVADVATKRILKVNTKACRMFGYTEKEFLRKKIIHLHPPSAVKKILGFFHDQAKGRMSLASDIPCRMRDGTVFFADVASRAASLEGKPCLVSFFRDISQRKLAEEREREVSRRLESVFNSTFEFMVLLKPDGRILEVNPAALNFGGVTLSQVQGQPVWESPWWTISKTVQKKLRRAVAQASRGKFIRYPVEVLGKHGKTMEIDFSLKPVKNEQGQVILLMAEGRDLTERRLSEASLVKSAQEWQSTFDAVGDVVWLLSPEGRILRTNKAVLKVLGKRPAEVLGRRCCEVVHGGGLPPQACPFRRMKKTHARASWEFRLGQRWLRVTVDPIWGGRGAVTGAVHIVSDITVRKQGENALRASENRYRGLVNLAVDGILTISSDDIVTDANEVMCAITGMSRDSLVGKHIERLPFDKASLQKYPFRADLLKKNKTVVRERTILRPDGTRVEVEMRTKMMPDGTYESIFRDVTERKAAEEKLRTSEQHYRSIFESSQDAMMTLEPPFWKFTSGNAAMVRMFRSRRTEDFLAHPPWALSPRKQPDGSLSREKARRMISIAMRRGSCFFSWMHRRLDGTLFPAEVLLTRVAREEGSFLHAVVRDVTESERAEASLRESEERFRLVVNNSVDAFYRRNIKDGYYDFFSPSIKAVTGFSSQELIGKPLGFIKRRVHPDDLRATEKILKKALSGRLKECTVDYRFRHKNGSYRWLSDRFTVANDEKGRPLYWVGVSRDVTDQKLAEIELQKSEARFRSYFELPLHGIAIMSPGKGWIQANDRLCALLGYSRKELFLKTWREMTYPDDIGVDARQHRLLFSGKIDRYRTEKRYVRKDGQVIWTSLAVGCIRRPDGQVEFVCAVLDDITERKKAEEELTESERRYRLLTENSSDVIWTMNPKGEFTYVSPTIFRLRGYTAEEVMRQPLEKQIAPGSLPLAVKLLKDVWAQDRRGKPVSPVVAELEQLRKDGTTVWTEVSGEIVRDKVHGHFILGLTRDISERRRADALLKQREAYLTSIIENQPGVVWLKDRESRLLAANYRYAKWVGQKKPENVVGKTDSDFWPPKMVRKFRETDRRVMRERKHMAIEELIPVEGVPRWHETFKMPVFDAQGNVIGTTGFSHDITERKKAEAALQASEASLKLQMGRMPIGCIMWDEKFCVQSWNPAAEKIFGYSPEEATGKSAYELIVPDAVRSHIEKVWKRLLKRDQTAHSRNKNLTKDGRLILCKWTNTPICHDHGSMMGVLSMVEDITELKKAEDRIQDERRQLRQIIDAVPHLIFIHDRRGKFLLANRATADFYELSPKGIVGRKLKDIHRSKDEALGAMKDDAEVLASERMKIIMGQKITDSRGRLRVMHNIKMPFRLAGSNELAVLGVSVDITEQKKIEEFRNDIIKTVSHELRTPLSIEREGISLVLDGAVGPLADQQMVILRTVLRNIDRLSRMIDNLLDISRIEAGKIELCKRSVFLENLIKEAVFEFQPKVAGKNLTIVTDLVDETLQECVAADPDKIQQVMTNLLDNAIRFSSQGSITVRTRLLANEVECEVADEGIGIAPENITRMFEKFQQFGRVAGAGEKGLGLGLSIVKGIIDLHRGRIWVKSQPGKGTSVFFTLPKTRENLL